MSDILRIDCQGITCGLIPSLQETLNTTDKDVIEFVVRPHTVPQILNALATSTKWDVTVSKDGHAEAVRFSRQTMATKSNPLDII